MLTNDLMWSKLNPGTFMAGNWNCRGIFLGRILVYAVHGFVVLMDVFHTSRNFSSQNDVKWHSMLKYWHFWPNLFFWVRRELRYQQQIKQHVQWIKPLPVVLVRCFGHLLRNTWHSYSGSAPTFLLRAGWYVVRTGFGLMHKETRAGACKQHANSIPHSSWVSNGHWPSLTITDIRTQIP